jgi:excisionase family DNA binding protein
MSSNDEAPKSGFCTIPEAAKRLGLNATTLRRACKRGKFPHAMVGDSILISKSYLDKLELEAQG